MGCPPEFLKYMKHCRGLNFEEKPDYQLLITMLKELGDREGLNLDYYNYDWVAKCQKLTKQNPTPEALSPPPAPTEDKKEDKKEGENEAKPTEDKKDDSATAGAAAATTGEEKFMFQSFDEVQKMIMGDQGDFDKGGAGFMQNFE